MNFAPDLADTWGLVRVHVRSHSQTPWLDDPAELVDSILDAIPQRPAWQAEAACRGMDPDSFFLPRGTQPEAVEAARRVCRACPVAVECREWGIDEPHGIWGGLSPRQRQQARTARRRLAS
jgi:WhiB family redox-sensing transcriptional regulator